MTERTTFVTTPAFRIIGRTSQLLGVEAGTTYIRAMIKARGPGTTQSDMHLRAADPWHFHFPVVMGEQLVRRLKFVVAFACRCRGMS